MDNTGMYIESLIRIGFKSGFIPKVSLKTGRNISCPFDGSVRRSKKKSIRVGLKTDLKNTGTVAIVFIKGSCLKS